MPYLNMCTRFFQNPYNTIVAQMLGVKRFAGSDILIPDPAEVRVQRMKCGTIPARRDFAALSIVWNQVLGLETVSQRRVDVGVVFELAEEGVGVVAEEDVGAEFDG